MDDKIKYKIIRKNIKNIYIRIKDKEVIVVAPKRINESKIDEIVNKKSGWINKKLEQKLEDRNIDLPKKDYIYILGRKIPVEFKYKEIKNIDVELTEKSCIVFLPKGIKDIDYDKVNQKIEKKLNDVIEIYVKEAMEKYIRLTGLKPEKIVIRKFKSIWGNCSSKGVIKINQKLVHYKKEQIEYVCLHELTHLKYMNHQKEFWSYIQKYMPDYKEIAKELKQ